MVSIHKLSSVCWTLANCRIWRSCAHKAVIRACERPIQRRFSPIDPRRSATSASSAFYSDSITEHPFRTHRKDWLKDEIYAMGRKHFDVVRELMRGSEWDYLHFVEIGLDRLQHGFWKFHDPQHVLHEPGNPYQEVIRDYYRYLDEEVGRLRGSLRHCE